MKDRRKFKLCSNVHLLLIVGPWS